MSVLAALARRGRRYDNLRRIARPGPAVDHDDISLSDLGPREHSNELHRHASGNEALQKGVS